MDFAATLSFLVLYYIRPQEWIPVVESLRPVTLVMGWALVATVSRPAGFTWRELFRTPHDGLMLAYLLWVVITAHNPLEAFSAVYNLYAFYVVTVLALSSLERIGQYVACWAGLIVTIGTLGVASTLGFDPMGSRDVTEGVMQGRLSLGTQIFNNANALGHSVVPVLLLLYVLLAWRRSALISTLVLPLAAVQAYCVYLTFSKGAYLSGFFTAVVSLCFRRSRWIQASVVAGSLTLGVAGLQQLPRMSTMGNTKADEGIQRRSAAFRFGYESMLGNLTGLGYNRFIPKIEARGGRLVAGPHSSFVRVGGEFGLPGLFLFCSILFACFRTVYAARTVRKEEERIQRALLVLLVSFSVSSWAIDWSLAAYFVLLVASIASFHRHLLQRDAAPVVPDGIELTSGTSTTVSAGTVGDVGSTGEGRRQDGAAGVGSSRRRRRRLADASPTVSPGPPLWNRVRWRDVVLFGGATLLVLMVWRHGMNVV